MDAGPGCLVSLGCREVQEWGVVDLSLCNSSWSRFGPQETTEPASVVDPSRGACTSLLCAVG